MKSRCDRHPQDQSRRSVADRLIFRQAGARLLNLNARKRVVKCCIYLRLWKEYRALMHIKKPETEGRKIWRIILPVILWLLLTSPLYADIIYTVKDGDSAWSIAVHFGISLDDLYEANGWASDENPVLHPDQRIAIPSDRDDESSGSENETSGETTYIVQSGDNPSMIAHRFGIGTLTLLEYNGLTENDLIQPGQLLKIPPDDYEYQGNAETDESTEADNDPPPEPIQYTVQAGDNPWGIARRFGQTVQSLLSFNNLTATAVLHVGDILLIPADAGSLSSRSNTWIDYIVVPDDTLSGIASAHDVSLIALAEANNIGTGDILRDGQRIKIPSYRSIPAQEGTDSEPAPPLPPEDLSGELTPLPRISDFSDAAETSEGLSGWHSEIFDFTKIEAADTSTSDPIPVSDGGLSVDGYFDDNTPYHLYTVRRGDTIGEVAHSFGITQSELMSRNGLDIRSMLRIGRDLRIPLPKPTSPQTGSGSSGSITWGAPGISIGDGTGTDLGRSLVEEASKYLGTPYSWGGVSLTSGVDCSGFTLALYNQIGISLPHRARDQAECGVEVDYADLLPGDLILFHTTRSGISHVGMYIGGGEFIHSSSHKGGVVISPLDTGYYNQRFVCARRLI